MAANARVRAAKRRIGPRAEAGNVDNIITEEGKMDDFADATADMSW